MLSHLDTVHPMGIIEDPLTWRREGDHVQGPRHLRHEGRARTWLTTPSSTSSDRGKSSKPPITFLYIPEEEVGSPTSQAMIEDEAKKHNMLVTEPARDGNKCVTERRGSGRFEVRTIGRQAHSGMRHQDGRSAISKWRARSSISKQ